jgi:hypothetical protein
LERGSITGQMVFLNWTPEGRSPGHFSVGKEHLATGSMLRPPMLVAARCPACGLGLFASATDPAASSPIVEGKRPPVRDALIDLEKRFWRAAGDPGFYRDHFADDGMMAFPIGLMSKPEVVAATSGPDRWERFTIDDPRVIEIAPGVASLTYTTVARPMGADDEYRAAVSSVYALRGGRWSLVLHQQTPLTT